MEIPDYEKNFLHGIVLSPFPTILDVGANVGEWAKVALEAHPEAKIYCFDPNPTCVEILQQYPEFTTFQIALSNERGRAEFYSGPGTDLGASLHFPHYFHPDGSYDPGRYPVWTDTLSEFFFHLGDFYGLLSGVDLLKIDAEGSEYNILVGAGSYLRKDFIQVIEFEYAGWGLTTGVKFKDIWDLLTDKGYTLFHMETDELVREYSEELEATSKGHMAYYYAL